MKWIVLGFLLGNMSAFAGGDIGPGKASEVPGKIGEFIKVENDESTPSQINITESLPAEKLAMEQVFSKVGVPEKLQISTSVLVSGAFWFFVYERVPSVYGIEVLKGSGDYYEVKDETTTDTLRINNYNNSSGFERLFPEYFTSPEDALKKVRELKKDSSMKGKFFVISNLNSRLQLGLGESDHAYGKNSKSISKEKSAQIVEPIYGSLLRIFARNPKLVKGINDIMEISDIAINILDNSVTVDGKVLHIPDSKLKPTITVEDNVSITAYIDSKKNILVPTEQEIERALIEQVMDNLEDPKICVSTMRSIEVNKDGYAFYNYSKDYGRFKGSWEDCYRFAMAYLKERKYQTEEDGGCKGCGVYIDGVLISQESTKAYTFIDWNFNKGEKKGSVSPDSDPENPKEGDQRVIKKDGQLIALDRYLNDKFKYFGEPIQSSEEYKREYKRKVGKNPLGVKGLPAPVLKDKLAQKESYKSEFMKAYRTCYNNQPFYKKIGASPESRIKDREKYFTDLDEKIRKQFQKRNPEKVIELIGEALEKYPEEKFERPWLKTHFRTAINWLKEKGVAAPGTFEDLQKKLTEIEKFLDKCNKGSP